MITKPMIFLFVLVSLLLPVTSLAADCEPTREDYLGPFYTPDAPQRNRLGTGYVLAGTVRSVKGCRPLHGAKVEVWQTGPDGRYADAYRAILIADDQGHYRLETTRPPPYGGRPAHIHLRISADGHRTLATQHYPKLVQTQVELDLVLSLQTDKE